MQEIICTIFRIVVSSGDKMTRKMIWILKKGKTKSKSDLAKYYYVLNIDFFHLFLLVGG